MATWTPPPPPAGGAAAAPQYVRALYDYPSTVPQVLSMARGDLFTVVNRQGDWYTVVDKTGKSGLLPANYVQPYDASTAATTGTAEADAAAAAAKAKADADAKAKADAAAAAATAAANTTATASANTTAAPAATPLGKVETATALYDYTSTMPQIPSFKKGDVFQVTGQTGDWLTIVKDGKQGVVPKNYVSMNAAAPATAAAPVAAATVTTAATVTPIAVTAAVTPAKPAAAAAPASPPSPSAPNVVVAPASSRASGSGSGSGAGSAVSSAATAAYFAQKSADDAFDHPVHTRTSSQSVLEIISQVNDEKFALMSPVGTSKKASFGFDVKASADAVSKAGLCAVSRCTFQPQRGLYCLRHCWRQDLEDDPLFSTKRGKVAMEILTTELSYSKGLNTAIRAFLLRLRTAIELNRTILPAADIDAVFGNLEELAKLSEKLVTDLHELLDEGMLLSYIAVTLLHYAPQFRVYQAYMEGYDLAIVKLHDVMGSNKAFSDWLEVTQKCEGLSLESFLIMPVQRLPRYLLLLDELKRNTDKTDTAAMDDLVEAHRQIQAMASALNNSLRQKDAVKKVAELQKKFDKDSRYASELGELATPTRALLREGPLSKKFAKTSRQLSAWKEYYFFLFNDIIVYADKVPVLGTYKLKHVVPIRDMKVSKGEGTIIELKAKSGKSFPVQATTEADRDAWYTAISKAVESIDSLIGSATASGGAGAAAGNAAAMTTGIAAQKGASSAKLAAMLTGKTDG